MWVLCYTEPGRKQDEKEIMLMIRNSLLEQQPHREKKVSILSVNEDFRPMTYILKSDMPKGTLKII